MTKDPDDLERITVSDMPGRREEVRETTRTMVRSSPAGWWIAAIVAIVAVVGLVFLFTSQHNQTDLQAARDQGAVLGASQATVEAASADAQRSATQASLAAQATVDSTARASQRAAEAAQIAADHTARAAQSAGDAARDATTAEPAPAPAPAPQQ